MGRICRQSVAAVSESERFTSRPDRSTRDLQQQLQHIFPIYTTYQLTQDDFNRVGNIPYKPKEEAKVKAMLYRSMTEFIAERYHSGENFITKLNKDLKSGCPEAG